MIPVRTHFLILTALLGLTGTAMVSAQATVAGFSVGKKQDFLQTSSATPVSSAILGDPNGPYHFSADMNGSALNLLNPPPKVTTPVSIQYALTGDTADVGVARNYSTKTALDTAFPNGNYTLSAGGMNFPISLGTGDEYPTDIPRLTSGTWNSQGMLQIDPTSSPAVNFSNFSQYTSGAGGMIIFGIYPLSNGTLGTPIITISSNFLPGIVTENALTSLDIRPFVAGNQQTFYAELSFVRIVNLDTSALPRVGLAAYVSSTGFIISTAPPEVFPFFRVQPHDQNATIGTNVNLSCWAEGNPAPTIQWFKNGAAISGATTDHLNFGSVQFADAANYTVVLTNRVGSVTSRTAILTVSPKPLPVITSQPTGLNASPGVQAYFSVGVTGEFPMTFQWYLNDQAIPGATSTSLTIPSVQPSDAGSYTFVATNAGGSVTSNAAVLSLIAPVGVIKVDAGTFSSFFLKSDGSFWGTGGLPSAALGFSGAETFLKRSPVKIDENVATMAAGSSHCLFVKKDGSLWAMGNNDYGQLGDGTTTYRSTPVQISTNVVAVTAGQENSLFIKSDGTLWAMGHNDSGELGVGNWQRQLNPVLVDTDVMSVTAGYEHTAYVKSDGSLWAIGENYFGQPDYGFTHSYERPIKIAEGVRIAFVQGSDCYCIKQDSSFWNLGPFSLSQNPPNSNQWELLAAEVSAAACGSDEYDAMLWLNNAGKLWSPSNRGSSPSIVLAEEVTTAAAGRSHIIFAKKDGSLWGKGDNTYGQLGNNSGSPTVTTPIKIADGVITPPPAPTGGSASGVVPSPTIRLNWNPTIAATSYEVWRNTTNNSGTATRIARNVEFALFFDPGAQIGVAYYYWVKAVNPAGASSFSSALPAIIIAPPANAVLTFTVE